MMMLDNQKVKTKCLSLIVLNNFFNLSEKRGAERVDNSLCSFCGIPQEHRNKCRHQKNCAQNTGSNKYLKRIIYVYQYLIEQIKKDNPNINTPELMLKKIDENYLNYVANVQVAQFFKDEFIKITKTGNRKMFFFEKSIQNGFEKGYFNKFFNKQNIEIYKPR